MTTGTSGALTETPERRARFIHRQTTANAMRFTTVELSDLESRIANAAEKALAIELAAYDRMVRAVVDAAEEIKSAANALAVIDVSASLAALADEQAYCRPHVDDTLDFCIRGGRHPVVEQALKKAQGAPFVANHCDLSPLAGQKNGGVWLLTGPNMGGKSTFLRQNALIAILAQMGSYVPAERRGSASSTGCSPASAPPTISPAAAPPSWWKWSRRRRSSTRPRRARW